MQFFCQPDKLNQNSDNPLKSKGKYLVSRKDISYNQLLKVTKIVIRIRIVNRLRAGSRPCTGMAVHPGKRSGTRLHRGGPFWKISQQVTKGFLLTHYKFVISCNSLIIDTNRPLCS